VDVVGGPACGSDTIFIYCGTSLLRNTGCFLIAAFGSPANTKMVSPQACPEGLSFLPPSRPKIEMLPQISSPDAALKEN
jgi:hypothetical protein